MKSNDLIDIAAKLVLVSKVRKNWSNKNVDLNVLTEQLGDFLKTCDFEAVKGQTEKGYQIFAQNSPRYKFGGYFSVTIEGTPQEFSIDLELCGKNSKRKIPSRIMSTALLGGGYLISRAFKAQDEWMRFEKDFWEQVDRVIDYLSIQ
jgi:hypothetical protein